MARQYRAALPKASHGDSSRDAIQLPRPEVIDPSDPVQLFDGATLLATFDTIQEAIDAAVDGNTIRAAAGHYLEDLLVDVDVTIEGANAGIAGTGTRGAETEIEGQIVIEATGVTLDGIMMSGTALSTSYNQVIDILPGADNATVVNSVFAYPEAWYAIAACDVAGLDIGHNLFLDSEVGVWLYSELATGSVHDNLFQGDAATNLVGGIESITTGVLIQNNAFDEMFDFALALYPVATGPVDLNSFVTGNTITNSFGPDVVVTPTPLAPDIIGTDHAEDFDALGAVPSGTGVSFDGRGGDDLIAGFDGVDVLSGGDGSDAIFGDVGDDVLTGGLGGDLIDGGCCYDTAMFAGNLVFLDTLLGWVIGSDIDGNDILQSVEFAVDGNGQRNLLVGAGGFFDLQEALDYSVTDDHLRLAAGNYNGLFNYTADSLTVIAQTGAVQNVVYVTSGGDGIAVLAAGGADRITSWTGDDHLNGGGGNDVLDGGAGGDLLEGGTGNDWFYVDNTGDAIGEAAAAGADRLFARASYTLTAGAEVELMSTANHAGIAAIDLTGNELVNLIYGNAGDNVLDGGGGADTLIGWAGDDTFHVDNAADRVIEAGGEGTDRVAASVSYALAVKAEVEVMSTDFDGGTAAINLTGNELANTIYGNDGANVLNGGGGADSLFGRLGNDWFYVDNAGDTVSEAAGEGADRLFASLSYTLAAGVEIEVMSTSNHGGTGAIDLTGNEFTNAIYGNAGDNVLDGKDGNDVLVGQGGGDSFAFTTAPGAGNVDRIVDFAGGSDRIALDDAVFTQAGGLGALNANAFHTGAAAHDGDDRIVYNQATGQLFYDADGDGAGAAVLFATLQGAPVIAASDFVVI